MKPLPFHPEDAAFNRTNALYLAHAADVAYHRAPAKAALERLGLQAFAFRSSVMRTRGFLGVCDTHAVLVYRGSDPLTLQTWVTDAIVHLVQREHYDGRVHKGFSGALKHAWHRIEAVLKHAHGKPLFLAGHSMGGALAILTGCRLARAGLSPVAIYTYGAPRVGDSAFCESYALPTYRIVNQLDLVPELPLAKVGRIVRAKPKRAAGGILHGLKHTLTKVLAYDHVKTLVYIDRDGVIIPEARIEPWHRQAVSRAIATKGKSFHEGITDHQIGSYIRGLEGRVGSWSAGPKEP